MKSRYPMRPFVVPAVLGVLCAFGLVAALLSDGGVEAAALAALGLVAVVVAVKLIRPAR
jgi:hypothetical protein